MLVTGLTRAGDIHLQTLFRGDGIKDMATDITRFGTFGNPWHVAAYAVAKAVHFMGSGAVGLLMAGKTELISLDLGLASKPRVA